jgi:hypothetical protein
MKPFCTIHMKPMVDGHKDKSGYVIQRCEDCVAEAKKKLEVIVKPFYPRVSHGPLSKRKVV